MIQAQQRNHEHLIVLPKPREFERTEISANDLRVMIKNLQLAIQASQNTLNMAARNLEGVRDFMDTEPIITYAAERRFGMENACHYIAIAAALLMLFVITLGSQPPPEPSNYHAHATRTHHG